MVVVLAACFFIASGSFNYSTQKYAQNSDELDFVKWLSPDETSNYIFAKLYAQTGEIKIQEDYNLKTKEIMHPRSFRSDAGTLKPVSFLGIILIYGRIANLFGYQVIPYLTPFFGALGIIFFYLFIKKVFDKNVALVSSLVLSCFPPFVYYSARSMFHNVLFTVLLLMGLYFGILMLQKRKEPWRTDWRGMFFAALSGFAFGLSAITRSSELLWLAPSLFMIWVVYAWRMGIVRLLVFLSFIFLAIMPVMYCNQILYDSPLSGGYSEMNQSILNIKNAGLGMVSTTIQADMSRQKELIATIKKSIFHFGIHPRQSWQMVRHYFIEMFPLLFWSSLLGFVLFAANIFTWRRRHFTYLSVLLFLSFVLFIYYGSWKFNDNPDVTRHTIGNSYTRYWLPVYLGAIPFAAILIVKISRAISNFGRFFRGSRSEDSLPRFFSWSISKTIVRFVVQSFLLAPIFLFSIHFVLIGSEEGLVYAATQQRAVYPEWKEVLRLTEHNSTLITRYHDKLFFPERKVIMGDFNDQRMVEQYANLAKYLPLYYYNFTLPKESVDWLNQRRLGEVGLGIEKVSQITKDFTLYRIIRK